MIFQAISYSNLQNELLFSLFRLGPPFVVENLDLSGQHKKVKQRRPPILAGPLVCKS